MTHIPASVKRPLKARYRDRKGAISQNVLLICDFDGIILYVLPGWEGSAHDAAVLNHACQHD